MTKYELMLIVNPDIGGDATEKRLEKVRKLIKSQKGEVFYEDLWGIKDLAYAMKKHDAGYYAVLYFNLDEDGDLNEIDTTLRLENEILRHMIVKLPSIYEPKSFANRDEEEEPDDLFAADAEKKTVKKVTKEKKEVKASQKAPSKSDKKEDKSLKDVDAKLKSIIDNPDLNF